MNINLPSYEENPTEVDMSIADCKKALLQITKVEPKDNSERGISNCVDFHLKIVEHDDDSAVGREFKTTLWEPDLNQTQLKIQAAVARWKQLCLATGVGPDGDGNIDPHAFHGEKFYGEIKGKKGKDGKVYANLEAIFFDNQEG
jgi:hypothetical protein